MKLDYKWRVAIVCAIGLFMAVLDNTVVSVALPQMQSYFHTDRTTITWVATGYFLAQAAVIPIVGYLSDRVGTKIPFILALILFTLGSALCAAAPSESWLIGIRVLQGIGGGALFPLAFAIVFRVFKPEERGPAGAVIGVPVLLAPAFGPTVGGILTTAFDWRAIFLINVPVGVVALVLAVVVLHGNAIGDNAPDHGRFDVLGLVLSMVGFTAVVYGIQEAGALGTWSDRGVIVSLIIGGVLLVAFIVVELVVPDPVMDVRLFTNYTFTASNVLMWAVSGFLFASLYLLPIFFQQVQGATPAQSGEYVISQGLGAAVSTVLAGRFYNRVGPRWLAFLGFALVTIGTFSLTTLTVGTPWQSLQGWFVVRGLGLGFTNIPLQTLAVSVVSNKAMARASSLINVTRQVASAIGITILTTYFVTQTTGYAQSYATTHAPEIRAYIQQQAQTYVSEQVQAATKTAVVAYSSGSPTDPSTPLGKLTAACAAPYGAAAAQKQVLIQVCVEEKINAYAQSYAQQYAAQNGPALGAQFAAEHGKALATAYVTQHDAPRAATQGLNDTFLISALGCAAGVLLALFVGRDPAVEAAKRAKARGEIVEARPMIIGE